MEMTLTSRRIATLEERNARRKSHTTKLIWKIVIFAACLFYAFLLMVPFYTIFVQSITPYDETMAQMSFIWWPENVNFESYTNIFLNDPNLIWEGYSSIAVGFLNTIWSSLICCFAGLFVSGLAAFAYAKLKFKGKEVLFMIMLITIMIPTGTLSIPSYIFYDSLGWVPGYAPLIIPSLFGSIMTIFFLRSYMMSIPTEIVEAAKIDGLGPFTIYWRIMIIETMPAFIAQFIFAFVGNYNNYQGPLLYLTGEPKTYTLQLAVSMMQSSFGQPAEQCAIAIFSLVPLLIVYLIFQRFFIEGIAVGGGKE